MARPLRPLSWRVLVPVVGVLSAVGVTNQLGRLGGLVVHQCVADGGFGWLGLRLALLRADAICPNGSLAVGGDQRQVLAVVIGVAGPVLLGHLVAACVGVGGLAHLRRLARGVLAVLTGVRTSLPDDVLLPAGASVALGARYLRPTTRNAPLVPWWRGPPALQFA
jgi:hypothetical protein